MHAINRWCGCSVRDGLQIILNNLNWTDRMFLRRIQSTHKSPDCFISVHGILIHKIPHSAHIGLKINIVFAATAFLSVCGARSVSLMYPTFTATWVNLEANRATISWFPVHIFILLLSWELNVRNNFFFSLCYYFNIFTSCIQCIRVDFLNKMVGIIVTEIMSKTLSKSSCCEIIN